LTPGSKGNSHIKSKSPLKFDALTCELIARLVCTSETRVDPEITEAIRRIAEFLGCDWGILARWGSEKLSPVLTHRWSVPGAKRIRLGSGHSPAIWILRVADAGEPAIFSHIDDLPPDAVEDKAFFRKLGVEAVLSTPLKVGGRVSGALVFAGRQPGTTWPDEILRKLNLIVEVMARTLERAKTRIDLERQLRFQTLLTEISARFVNLPADKVDQEVSVAQRRVCESLDIDRCVLWQAAAAKPGTFLLTHLYQGGGIPPGLPGLNAMDRFPWALRKVLAGEAIVFSRLSELPAEAALDVESYRRGGTKSSVAVPLSVGSSTVLGGLTFDSIRAERDWPDEFVKQLFLVAQVIANALARKRSDEVLLASEERFRMLIEHAPIAIGLGRAGSILKVNLKYLEVFGYRDEEELRGRPIIEQWAPQSRQGVREIARHFEEGALTPVEFEGVGLRKGGTVIPVRAIISRVQLSDGPAAVAFKWDITEEKSMLEAQRRAQEQYLALFNNAQEGIYQITPEGKVLAANPAMAKMMGYDSPEEIVSSITDSANQVWLDPSERSRYVRLLEEHGFVNGYEARFMRKDKTPIWISISSRRVCGPDGRTIYYEGLNSDITARKLAEEALREGEARYRLLAENSTDVIWTTGLDGRFTYVSPSVEQLRGFSVAEVLQQHFEDAFAPDSARKVREALACLAADSDPHSANCRLELEQPRKDGTSVWTEADISLHSDGTGRALGLLGLSRDISEKREIEQEVERLRAQSRHAERAARMGILTSSLAHELSQPLAAILCNAQAGLLLLDREKPDLEEIRSALEDIVGDDTRAGGVLSGLRRVHRPVKLNREATSLARVIREVTTMLQREILEHRIAVDTSGVVDCVVPADKGQIQQVLLNLVMNAIEAMQARPLDQRRLKFTVAEIKGEAQIAVCDSGPGIPAHHAGKMFVEAFRTTKHDALGIGLVICRSIVESHAGRVWFADNPDAGATFFFTLPLQKGRD